MVTIFSPHLSPEIARELYIKSFSTEGTSVRERWKRWTESWEEQISEHRREAQYGGALVGGFLIGGPVGASTATAAMAATVNANELKARQEALEAAKTSFAQDPSGAPSDSGIGATGELAFSKGISQWIPVGFIFIVVMYFLFKR